MSGPSRSSRSIHLACAALAVTTGQLTGCAKRVPYELSYADAKRFVQVARVPARAGHDPLIFGASDCTIYKAITQDQQITGWRVVLRSDWGQTSYPKFLTACARESVTYNGKYVLVFMCAQALGAGGGCAGGGGTYRSRDGEKWEVPVYGPAGWGPLHS